MGVQYAIYILRWIILAIPGTWLFQFFCTKMEVMPAMLLGQAVLGAMVFWIDRWIFRGGSFGSQSCQGRRDEHVQNQEYLCAMEQEEED